jgi:hypothetical protein
MADGEIPQYWCKATTSTKSRRPSGLNRMFGKRSLFQIYDEGIICGRLSIAYSEVEKALVRHTTHWFLPVTVLLLITAAGEHRFQFNPWAMPERHLKLDFEETDG